MQVRTRKLIGTVVLLLFLAVYVTLAAMIGSGPRRAAPAWVQFAYLRRRGSCLGHPGRAPHPLDAATDAPSLGGVDLLEAVPQGERRARQIERGIGERLIVAVERHARQRGQMAADAPGTACPCAWSRRS